MGLHIGGMDHPRGLLGARLTLSQSAGREAQHKIFTLQNPQWADLVVVRLRVA